MPGVNSSIQNRIPISSEEFIVAGSCFAGIRDIPMTQKFFKKISTHLLIVLIMSAILHIEQRRRNKKKSSESGVENVDNTQEQSESA